LKATLIDLGRRFNRSVKDNYDELTCYAAGKDDCKRARELHRKDDFEKTYYTGKTAVDIATNIVYAEEPMGTSC
jgi:hypothetical protein